MNWLNIHTDTLRSEEYLGAAPVERATWLNLMAWCASQENGGVIEGASEWGERKWMQVCGVTKEEATLVSGLYQLGTNGEMIVSLYPLAKEDEVKGKRETARINGKKGGRPPKEPTLVPEITYVAKRKGREGKGKRRKREGKEETPLAPKGERIPFDSDNFKTTWKAWEAHRTEIKKKLTPTQKAAQLKRLGKMTEQDAIAIIENTIEKGWQGLRAEDVNHGGHKTITNPRIANLKKFE